MNPVAAIRRRRSPFPSVMPGRAYRQVRSAPPLTVGTARVFDREVAYSDNIGLLHSLDEIFVEEVYRFTPETDRPHIIDAGANIGLSVIYFKRLCPAATVIAYEPDPAIFKLLQQNVADWPDVELRQAAAWNADTELSFFSEGSLAGSTQTEMAATGQRFTVKAERLRDELRKRPVDFLKIDIEGAEAEVLFDIEQDLGQVRNLFFEYHSVHDGNQQLGELLNLVKRQGFRYLLSGAHGPRHPFIERYQRGFDLQVNVSCVRA